MQCPVYCFSKWNTLMIWLVAGLLVMFVAIKLFYLRGEDLRKFDSPRPEPAGIVDQPSDQHQAVLK
jgi:hypothetical protein